MMSSEDNVNQNTHMIVELIESIDDELLLKSAAAPIDYSFTMS